MTDTIKFIEYLVDKNIINNENIVKMLIDYDLKKDELLTKQTDSISETINNISNLASSLFDSCKTKDAPQIELK